MKKKESKTMHIMTNIWQNLDYSSHQRVNQGMSSILCNLIEIGINFEPNDIHDIYSSFRGGYWFGVSRNGKTMGEQFYRSACDSNPNTSAAQSFELWTGRKPFILDNHRLYEGASFTMDKLYWTVSGFEDEKRIITCVGYENGMQEGKRKLMKLTNEEFLVKRKLMELR